IRLTLVMLLLLVGTFAIARADEVFSKVEALLKARCYECHSHEKKIRGGLSLDSKSGWEKGGESGPSIVPGKPEASLFIKALGHAEVDLKMPPKGMLPSAEIEVFKEWIRLGAKDPRVIKSPEKSKELATQDAWDAEFKKRLDWWSLKPMVTVLPPMVQNAEWSGEPIDRFIRSALDRNQLQPAPPASPEVLLRRLYFVLTGLPPKPSEVKDFLQAPDGTSYEKVVDRLLQSPNFGEHFARHWMDVVRYTDTYGYEWDNPAKGAFEYRDYLVRAFNDDIGFDQLLREQIAGDLIASPRIHPKSQTQENLIGPMFYHMGEHRHGSSLMFNGIHQEMVNNKIDAFSKAFLATTVACARCHDHKLEAVSQRDYYALAAVFTTPRWTSRVVDAPANHEQAIHRLKTLRDSIHREMASLWGGVSIPREKILAALGDVSKAKPTIDEVTFPLLQMGRHEKGARAAWNEARQEWLKTRDQRKLANRNFKWLADGSMAVLPPGWVTEGAGFEHGYTTEATPRISLDGEKVLATLLPRGFHTHALSSKLPGALRMPPEHQVAGKFLSVQISGGEFGGYLVMDDHAFQNETVTFLNNPSPQWKTFSDASLKNGVQQVTVEFATCSLNPNFPPRTGLAAGLKSNDFGYDKRSWISITGIASHDVAGAPQKDLSMFSGLFEEPAPDTDAAAWKQAEQWLEGAVKRWCRNSCQPGDAAMLDWMLSHGLLVNRADGNSKLAGYLAEYRAVEASMAFPRTVNSMDERETTRANYPLNIRGNVDVLGQAIHPDFLQMFAGTNGVARSNGSGRLELADALTAPEHPVTSRVYVNRVWQWIFGTGLVATPDDFGRLGEKPSHPELLDYLARQFIREGWSTRKLVRRMVLSQAFRQGGDAHALAREKDPSNRLLHHYPTRRLEAEAIRDALLAVSGRLDSKLYGRPVLPYRTVEDPAKRLFSGPLDGDGRRSIYLQMSIMDPPKFLVGFNLPDLKLPTGRRDMTNVPSQALIMMNDPFVHAMAKHWATRILGESHPDSAQRIRVMFLEAFGRWPNAQELQRWQKALLEFSEPSQGDHDRNPAAWQHLAHIFFNTKEFMYYR
ncbi:MAG: hypothetical protein RL595_2768, partial [Planctomycetota bacterium]